MARRPRLSPAREAQKNWLWHTAKTMTLPASALSTGDRRMEAESYLSSGYGQRLALDAVLSGGGKLADFASVWQPSRLKGTVVSPEYGTPFLAATQAYDLRPIPRKFLSLNKTDDSASRFVESGTIIVTCSGTVGRATLATDAIARGLLSHDLLRVTPTDDSCRGWIYAYLRASTVRQMMSSSQYGHMIKHLEPAHLQNLPMPRPRTDIGESLNASVDAILSARNIATAKMLEAENLFLRSVGDIELVTSRSAGFSVKTTEIFGRRRRLEATFHSPDVTDIQKHFTNRGLTLQSIADMGCRVWLPNRFKRIIAQEGVELVGSSDIFEVNPDLIKRIVDIRPVGGDDGRVKRGWLLLARSGQTYGLNGNMVIANAALENKIVSDHVIRIVANSECKVRSGYIYTALSHPLLGRPLLKSLAYGSSIPEIEVADVAALKVVRLDAEIEDEIADLAEKGAQMFADADIAETKLGADADMMLKDLIAGDWSKFVPFSARIA